MITKVIPVAMAVPTEPIPIVPIAKATMPLKGESVVKLNLLEEVKP